MSQGIFRKMALAAALASMGFAGSAMAAGTAPGAQVNATTTAQQQAWSSNGASQGQAMNEHGARSQGRHHWRSGSLTRADRHFVREAAKANREEVAVGRLAVAQAHDPAVKQFAQRMVDDHTKANRELKQIAQRDGFSLPTRLDTRTQHEIGRLSQLSGPEFDQAYMKHQASDHRKVIHEFRHEADSGRNADLRHYASETLPTLQQHLALSRSTDRIAHNETGGEHMASSEQGWRSHHASDHMASGGQHASSQGSGQGSTSSGLKAAQQGTGASYGTAERQEHMPQAKTHM
jgi:putative membrane protein